MSKGKRFPDQLVTHENVSRAQRQALWESYIYELEFPLEIQNVETKKNLWQELNWQKLRDECKKVEDWILDLGHMVDHVSMYEITIAFYYLMKNLVG